MSTTPQVYAAINAVQSAMAREGISKSRQNQQQGYAFRGIDDVYAALAPHLAKEKLCVLPRVTDRTVTERTTKSGGVLFYTTLTVEFDFVSVADGSKHTVCTVGEAMDSGDKSSNKAMSAAYKYACFLAFAIPTEGDNDADAVTHEPAAPAPYKAEGPPITDTTKQALSDLCRTVVMSNKIDAAMQSKGVMTFDELSEADAVKLLAWAHKQQTKAA